MKNFISLIFILAFFANGFSQTKKVFHRSHSGKNAGFSIYADGNLGYLPGDDDRRKKIEPVRMDTVGPVNMPVGGNAPVPGTNPGKKKPALRYDTIYYNSSHYQFIWVDETDSTKKKKDSVLSPDNEKNNILPVLPKTDAASGNNNKPEAGGIYWLAIILLVCIPAIVAVFVYLGKLKLILHAQLAAN